jgi:hypothetical protein
VGRRGNGDDERRGERERGGDGELRAMSGHGNSVPPAGVGGDDRW